MEGLGKCKTGPETAGAVEVRYSFPIDGFIDLFDALEVEGHLWEGTFVKVLSRRAKLEGEKIDEENEGKKFPTGSPCERMKRGVVQH